MPQTTVWMGVGAAGSHKLGVLWKREAWPFGKLEAACMGSHGQRSLSISILAEVRTAGTSPPSPFCVGTRP